MKLNKLFKKCFTCKVKYPLILFGKNTTKYSLPSDLGRLVECRFCCVKRFLKQEGKVVVYDPVTRKFSIKQYEVNLKTIFKTFFYA